MAARRLIIGGLCALCLLALVKPAILESEQGARLLVLFRWQSGSLRFTNSVTGGRVAISFRVGGRFEGFHVATDAGTEAYYTSGLYPMNEAASRDATPVLQLCSMTGISLTLGFYDVHLSDGCLEVRLLWAL
jgi:hypothetical protein